MRIYTKKGDRGTTSLFRGGRVPKNSLRVAAYGDIDELNSALGFAKSIAPADFQCSLLEEIQADLFVIGSILATEQYDESTAADRKMLLPESRVAALESAIDEATNQMLPLEKFVLPGGTQKASVLHLARSVCRRAERSVVALKQEENVAGLVLQYLNRLSDLLFTLARLANHRAGIADQEW